MVGILSPRQYVAVCRTPAGNMSRSLSIIDRFVRLTEKIIVAIFKDNYFRVVSIGPDVLT